MKVSTYQIDEERILDSTFNYLVKQGLENVTIRELCRNTGISQGSIYYWFSSKQELICEATEYALKKIVDEIFSYVFSNINDLNKFFDECLSEIDKYKDDLRFVYQMAASPVYGTKIRDRGQEFDVIYDKYVKKLALQLQCNEHKLKPIVYLFISAVLDYVIWENTKNTQLQLMFIYSVLKK